MYCDWNSLTADIQTDKSNRSVLTKFPESVGKTVVNSVVKALIEKHEESLANPMQQPSGKELDWTMEVVCYGLSLPLTDDDTVVKGCVNIYLDWLSVLLPNFKRNIDKIPRAVMQESDKYSQIILKHFRNLFIPRKGDSLQMQASLCLCVLQAIEAIVTEASLSKVMWEDMLRFLLSVNDCILAPPFTFGGLTDQLSEKLISVLFEGWLYACSQHFPSPTLWCTLREMCMTWRHHPVLVDHWNNLTSVLSRRVIRFLYGTNFPLPTRNPCSKRKHFVIPSSLDNECLVQCWFRFIHTLGNPVDLTKKTVVSNTRCFKEFALTSEEVISPTSHPCLQLLPSVFLNAMKGIAFLVDMFLGIVEIDDNPVRHIPSILHFQFVPTPPGTKRDLHKTASVGASLGLSVQGGISSRAFTHPSSTNLAGSRSTSSASLSHFSSLSLPSGNSVIHLFGVWLFEAALAHPNVKGILEELKGMDTSLKRSLTGAPSPAKDSSLVDEYEHGRAEAVGALCRIFCSQRSGQEVMPVYLSRFYIALSVGLQYDPRTCSGHMLSSILLNCVDLLRVDLQGVQVMIPYLLNALEIVLPRSDIHLRCKISGTVLRRASIQLLLSMICLPLHFQSLPIQSLFGNQDGNGNRNKQPLTFLSLKDRIIGLLLSALQCETDAINTQMLLAGMLLIIQDIADSEDREPFSTTTATPLTSPEGSEESSIPPKRKTDSTCDADNDEGSVFVEVKLQDSGGPCEFLVQLTKLLSQKLPQVSPWKTDLHVTLSALELLAGLADLPINLISRNECKKTVCWLCGYITHQARKPAPHHSRDLHSMIVAAFNCLLTWLVAHPWLMDNQFCLEPVLEVVELGISGSKSKESGPEKTEVKLKGEKDLKPASFRVREAAEALLNCIMDHLGSFPAPCGPSSLSSLLNEESLLACRIKNKPSSSTQKKDFKYYVLDNSMIIGLLEDSLKQQEVPLPTVTAVVRSPTGRYVWSMQLRHIAKTQKSLLRLETQDLGRPLPLEPSASRSTTGQRFFPEEVDMVPLTKADASIPALNAILDDKLNEVQDHMRNLMQKQAEYEKEVQEKWDSVTDALEFPSQDTEQKPPSPVKVYTPVKQLIAQFGLLTVEEHKEPPANPYERPESALIALDSSKEGFHEALQTIDELPTRPPDTVYVFYVKAGQVAASEILANKISKSSHKVFTNYLKSLGWPVDTDKHPGWTGNSSTSYKTRNLFASDTQPTVDSVDPANQILYYADVNCEVAFVIPSLSYKKERNSQGSLQSGSSFSIEGDSFDDGLVRPHRSRSGSLGLIEVSSSSMDRGHLQRQNTEFVGTAFEGKTLTRSGQDTVMDTRPLTRLSTHSTSAEVDIVIAWLEQFDDHSVFPIDELLVEVAADQANAISTYKTQDKETAVIFIHPLKSGLFRIHTRSTFRSPLAGPLVDGMVVSMAVLAQMTRQTVVNIGKRRRLEIDTYSSPHVCRKLKIQDVVRRYKIEQSIPDFQVSLFGKESK